MATDVCNYCKQYQTYQACNIVTPALQGKLQPLPIPEYYQQHIAMHIIACLPKIDRGINSIATFVDHLLKFTYFSPVITLISADDLV